MNTLATWTRLVADLEASDSPPNFEQMSQALMALGMSSAAATCRTWSLLPPEEHVWRTKTMQWNRQIKGASNSQMLPNTGEHHFEFEQSSQANGNLNMRLQFVEKLLDAGLDFEASEQMVQIAHENGLTPSLCNRVATLKERINDFWQAERWYRTSLSFVKDQPLAWFGLASTLLHQKAADEALEASQIGLGLHQRHPWGLKLQQRALTELGAVHNLLRLQERNELPFPFDFNDQVALQEAILPRLPDPFSLNQKLVVAKLLAVDNPLIWLLGPGSHKSLAALCEQDLIPADAEVQVFADPDWCGVFSSSRIQFQFRPGESKPLYWTRHQSQYPSLAIISNVFTSACSLAISPLIVNSSVSLLAPSDLIVSPASHQPYSLGADMTLWYYIGSK